MAKLNRISILIFPKNSIKILLVLLIILPNLIQSKDQYVLPLNMGMQIAIPYDIANIFNRPIFFARPISIFLAGCTLFLLFFGVITSPFGYMFGIPSEKYVLGQSWGDLTGVDDSASKLSYEFEDTDLDNDEGGNQYQYKENEQPYNNEYRASPRSTSEEYPNFLQSLFYWMPELEDEECRKMVLCYGHQLVPKVPQMILKGYQLFSKKLSGFHEGYKDAIYNGLQSEQTKNTCEEIYTSCNQSMFGILVKSVTRRMPKWMRTKALKPNEYF